MHQLGKCRSIFTGGASAGDRHGEPAVVINRSNQIIAGLRNEIMAGVYGHAVSGELGFGTFGDAVAWLSSLAFACFSREGRWRAAPVIRCISNQSGNSARFRTLQSSLLALGL